MNMKGDSRVNAVFGIIVFLFFFGFLLSQLTLTAANVQRVNVTGSLTTSGNQSVSGIVDERIGSPPVCEFSNNIIFNAFEGGTCIVGWFGYFLSFLGIGNSIDEGTYPWLFFIIMAMVILLAYIAVRLIPTVG